MVTELSRDDARRIAVRAQLLDAQRPGDVVEVAEQLGKIKIDPTATIATAEHTILWSRIGWNYEPGQLTKAVDIDDMLFEYSGAFRSRSLLPYMRARMGLEFLHQSTRNWIDANAGFRADIIARLRANGPLIASDIEDTSTVAHKSEAGWYGKTQTPRMLEVLEAAGDVAVSHRVGRSRYWDIADRVHGKKDGSISPEEAKLALEEHTLRAAGIAKEKSPWTRVGTAGEQVRVEGSSWKFRVDPQALETLDDDAGGRVAILNPYDPMLFDRPRLKELFGFNYVLEQFKPKAQRVYGYFAHPILIGDTFAGLLDAEHTKEGIFKINAIHELMPWEPEEQEMVRAEIQDLGDWLGAETRGLY